MTPAEGGNRNRGVPGAVAPSVSAAPAAILLEDRRRPVLPGVRWCPGQGGEGRTAVATRTAVCRVRTLGMGSEAEPSTPDRPTSGAPTGPWEPLSRWSANLRRLLDPLWASHPHPTTAHSPGNTPSGIWAIWPRHLVALQPFPTRSSLSRFHAENSDPICWLVKPR